MKMIAQTTVVGGRHERGKPGGFVKVQSDLANTLRCVVVPATALIRHSHIFQHLIKHFVLPCSSLINMSITVLLFIFNSCIFSSMPRKKRGHPLNTTYHVMLRGNFGSPVFIDDQCYLNFYDLLKRCCTQYGCKIYLFCLMTNHVHLVMHIANIPLSKVMMSLASNHSRRLNSLLNRKGHVFQDRYQAKPVSDSQYLLELCYYIHQNPVKAKMVKSVDDYPWSSHHCYMGNQSLPWLSKDHLLMRLSQKVLNSQDHYHDFIYQRAGCEITTNLLALDESGNIKMINSINEKTRAPSGCSLSIISINEIITEVCSLLKIEGKLIESISLQRDVVFARSVIAYIAHYSAGYTLRQIASFFGLMPDSLSRTMHKQACAAKFNEAVRKASYRLIKKQSEKISAFNV